MTTEQLIKEIESLKEEVKSLRNVVEILQKKIDSIENDDQAYFIRRTFKVKALADLLTKDVMDLSLSIRCKNILKASDICTFGDLIRGGERGLSQLRFQGRAFREEIIQFMEENKLTWDIDVDKIIKLSTKKSKTKKST